MRKLAVGVVGALAFALNPAFVGCGGKTYSFSAKEMNAAIAGTWKLTADSKTHTFTLAQKKGDVTGRAGSAFFSEATACGNRTLVASADACVDSTTMPLLVTFPDGSVHTATAELVVHGYDFMEGLLYLVIDDIDVAARIKPDGTIERMPEGAQLVHTR